MNIESINGNVGLMGLIIKCCLDEYSIASFIIIRINVLTRSFFTIKFYLVFILDNYGLKSTRYYSGDNSDANLISLVDLKNKDIHEGMKEIWKKLNLAIFSNVHHEDTVEAYTSAIDTTDVIDMNTETPAAYIVHDITVEYDWSECTLYSLVRDNMITELKNKLNLMNGTTVDAHVDEIVGNDAIFRLERRRRQRLAQARSIMDSDYNREIVMHNLNIFASFTHDDAIFQNEADIETVCTIEWALQRTIRNEVEKYIGQISGAVFEAEMKTLLGVIILIHYLLLMSMKFGRNTITTTNSYPSYKEES